MTNASFTPELPSSIREDLRLLDERRALGDVEFTSHRKMLGPAVLSVKRALRAFLTPLLNRQTEFNHATHRLLVSTLDQVDRLGVEMRAARAETVLLRAELEELQRARDILREQQRTTREQLAAVRAEVRLLQGENGSALEKLEAGISDALSRLEALLEEELRVPELKDPLCFESHLRAGGDVLRRRFDAYLPQVLHLAAARSGAPVVDLGAGRGDWLALVVEQGLVGRGVDLQGACVSACQARGLEVERGDALAYLQALAPASVACVSGFHLLEHLSAARLVRLLGEVQRVLVPGGLALFETPNPANPRVSGYSFWLDPTHRRPLPSETLVHLLEAAGLGVVHRVEHGDGTDAPPADYGVIARKAAR
jgi:SAM-dependent methyltransferase